MKRFVVVLMAVFFCCSFLVAGPVKADVSHVSENLNARCDYLVFSPEYSSSKKCCEMWLLAYRRSGSTANCEKDKCVSASLLSLKSPRTAAGKVATLLEHSYELEDMMDSDDVRYYMFYEFRKPCYLASPGGSLTTVSPINTVEFQESSTDCILSFISNGSNPGFMLLCQLWLYSSRFSQIPVSVSKIYGINTEKKQSLYSNNASDYCSNQEKLQKYCDSLIPVVSSAGSGDTRHSDTKIYYRKGGTVLLVSPWKEGLFVSLTAGK